MFIQAQLIAPVHYEKALCKGQLGEGKEDWRLRSGRNLVKAYCELCWLTRSI